MGYLAMIKIKRIFSEPGNEHTVLDTCKEPVNPNAGLVVKFNSKIWQWEFYDEVKGNKDYSYYLLYSLHPNQDAFPELYIPMPIGLRCECGAEKLNAPGHSTWCPKFGELK